jgi:antitoxin CptB
MSAQATCAPAAAEIERRRLVWRCRRGMKELDVLLARFARTAGLRANAAQRRVFATLLELPDPTLAAYLLGHERPRNPALARLVRRIIRGTDEPGDWS